jgi:hypothetical protein
MLYIATRCVNTREATGARHILITRGKSPELTYPERRRAGLIRRGRYAPQVFRSRIVPDDTR